MSVRTRALSRHEMPRLGHRDGPMRSLHRRGPDAARQVAQTMSKRDEADFVLATVLLVLALWIAAVLILVAVG